MRRELLPGQSTELLRELHLLTRDGDLNAKDLAGAISTISGTARSMGLDIN